MARVCSGMSFEGEVLDGGLEWAWGQQERTTLNLSAEVRVVCPDEEVLRVQGLLVGTKD